MPLAKTADTEGVDVVDCINLGGRAIVSVLHMTIGGSIYFSAYRFFVEMGFVARIYFWSNGFLLARLFPQPTAICLSEKFSCRIVGR